MENYAKDILFKQRVKHLNELTIETFVIFNKDILDKINDDLLLNKTFFYEKLDNYKNNKKDYGQYLWNEITLNLMLQKKFNN